MATYDPIPAERYCAEAVRMWRLHAGIDAWVPQYLTQTLVGVSNYCSATNRLRSAEEHRLLDCLGRWARRRLHNRLGWRETESGRLTCSM